jgi:hypothetical protein
MKKLALAIGLGAYIVFGASSGSLAVHRVENTAGAVADRDATIIWSETGMNVRLYSLNQMFYPDLAITWDTDTTFCAAGSCLSR